MQENWVETKGNAIKEFLGVEDTRDFVWSVAELQQYLEYVKLQSQALGITNPGIRVNFAAYGKSKSDKATVFFSPTIHGGEDAENNYRIESFNKGISGWPPLDFGD